VATIDPAGKFLFVTDLTSGRIFAYQINQSSGALTAAAGSPFPVPSGGQPSIAVTDGAGKFLYATLISGGIAAFTVDSVTGALINVPGSPFTTSNEPNSIAVSPTGKYLYVANFTDGSVDGFAIDTSSGALSIVGGSPFSTAPSPSNLVVDPSGDFLYVSISPPAPCPRSMDRRSRPYNPPLT
jgi:6-phosphogluconolactonase